MEAATRKASRPANSSEEDPDIAGIVPGPQPSPWGDELDDVMAAADGWAHVSLDGSLRLSSIAVNGSRNLEPFMTGCVWSSRT